ncbi:MAG: T9SS type A sorting domain-containing protein [Bacteroidetes bacterium]|nr:T9SS type A sorting domain-containing protein [Bacteroidota bacterium]
MFIQLLLKDPCGNTATQTVTIPSLVAPLMVFANYQNCGGPICVGTEGGCGPFTYLWSNGFTGPCLMTYDSCVDLTVTVTDVNGCSVTLVVSPPTVSFINVVQPTCCQANGSLCVQACFGQGPLTYTWSNGATGPCISGLAAGTYCVTITNANGQQTTCCYTLNPAPVIPPDVHFDVLNCGSLVNAYITSNGCPFTYHWQNGSTEPFFEQANSCDSLTLTIVMCDGTEYYHGFRVPGVIPTLTPVDCHTGVGSICVATECFRCPVVSYEWAPIIAGVTNDSACYANVPAGTYTVCITDSCGNRVCCTIILPPGDSLQIIHVTDTVYDITCDNLNGGIDVEVAGGYQPFTYLWSNGATTQDISNLVAGPYELVITDSVGCITIVRDTVFVNNDCDCTSPLYEPPTITVVSIDPDECNGSGCINATFTGCCLWFSYTYIHPCNPALSYSVPQTQDSTIFCNLNAGTYTIFVVDGCGNMVQQTIVVPSINPPLTALVTYSNCGTGACVIAQGGCGPYTYEWLGGSTMECISFTNPCTSTYVTITDSRGCSITVYLTAPGITFTNVVQPTCCQANGSLCVDVCFGQGPLTYLWSNEATTPCINNLAPGTYCVTITNALGQTVTCCYTLTGAPVLPPNVHFDVLNCGSLVNAYIESNGCPYTYHWQNGSTEPFFEQANSCDSLTLTIVMCDGTEYYHGFRVPGVIPTLTPVDCHTGVGSICVATECFRCPVVSYEWAPIIAGVTNDSACYANVPAGTYTVCITDSCGNRVCCTIILPPGDSLQIIHVTDTVYDITCDNLNGGIDVELAGGYPPFTYLWNTGATTQDISNLVAGPYELVITDSVGCITIVRDTVFVNNDCDCTSPLYEPPTITVVSIEPDECNGSGCINATFTGCCLWFSYTYIHPCNPALSYSVPQTQDSTIFCNLNAGTYTIFVVDGCGNMVQQTIVVPSINPPLTALVTYSNCGTGACVIAQGGCGPYTYEWLGGSTMECISFTSPCTSTYVTITDSRGCSITVYLTAPGITFTNVVQPTCCQANGSLCVDVCFGQGPLTYLWSNEATTPCINNLAPGTYCVTITNALGQTVTCCYTLIGAPVLPPNVHFDVLNCGSLVNAYIESNGCPYTYHWQNGSTEPFFEQANSCDSLTLTIVMCDGAEYYHGFRVPGVIPTLTPVDCHTGVGSICVATECFACPVVSYEWAPIIAGTPNDQACYANVPAGTYTVCITDSCGNRVCCTIILPPGDSLQIIHVTDTVYDITCDNLNGGIDVELAGGYPPFTYLWNTGATTQDISNLVAGPYELVITDSVGCITIVRDTVFVNNDCDCTSPLYEPPTITVVSIDPDECNGGGCINATFTGCCLWYSYTFIHPCNPMLSYSVAQTQDSTIFCNLDAGTYTIFVMDGCGNMVQQTVVVPSINPPLTALVTYSNCGAGACVIAQGGCGPYTYEWLGGSTMECISFTSPCTSTYVTITDSRGCSITVYLTAPGISFTNVVQPTCCQANGSLCVDVCFGQGPLTYLWSNEATTPCITGLAAGTYCVTITNALGQQFTCCYTLTDAQVATPPVHFVFNNCGSTVTPVFEESDCSNFTWYWDNNSTSLTRGNLTACDSITFTVVACNGQLTHHGFRVPALFATITPVNCATGMGMVCVTTECFRCPQYTYNWTNLPVGLENGSPCLIAPPGIYTLCITNACGDIICCEYIIPEVTTGITVSATTTNVTCFGGNNGTVTVSATGGTAPYTGTGVFNVAAGTYTYTVTDANGCSGTVTVTVTQPPRIVVTATATPILCNGGTSEVTISATGGTPPYQGTGIVVQTAGTYTYTVIDANGCIGTVTIVIAQPNPIVINYNATPITCYGGTSEVFISATGGTGPYQGTGFVILTAGTHQITVVDANGCVQTITITITQPPKVEGTVTTTPTNCGGNTGTATVSPIGGVSPYTYSWSPGGQTTQTATGLAAGVYVVTITDANGCTGTASGTVASTGVIPPTPGPITGPAGACRNTTGIVYSITPVPGATSYIWTLPPGATGSSTTTSISVSFGPTYAGGFICVSAVTPCGTSAPSCMNVPVLTTYPGVPISIGGPVIICGPTIATYTTTALNALGYTWAVTGGATILTGQGTNTITVSIPAGFGQGSVQVYSTNCFGKSAVKGILITGIPTHGYAVTGPTYVCANGTGTYSMPVVTGATSYVWTVSGDATLGTNTLSPTTTTQVINFGPTWTTGTVTVAAVNACGSYVKSFVVRSTPVQPGSISGPGNNLCNTSATYSIVAVAGATSYLWSVPPGVTIVGSATGLSVNVVFGPTFTTASANICVSAVNSCGTGPARCYTVTSRPPAPVITGPASVCKSNAAVAYTISPVAGASSYSWLVTGGATITPAPSGLSATVNYNTAISTSAVVRANAYNACGISANALKNVTVSLLCREANANVISTTEFSAYPNPTTGKLTLSFDSETKSKYLVEVENIIGVKMLVEVVNLQEGNNLHELDLSTYAKGMYFLSIKAEGAETKTIRIVVE